MEEVIYCANEVDRMWKSVYDMIQNKDLSVVANGKLKKLKKKLDNVLDCWKEETNEELNEISIEEDERVINLVSERDCLVNMLK